MTFLHPQDRTRSCNRIGSLVEKLFVEHMEKNGFAKISYSKKDDMENNIDFTATYPCDKKRTFQIKGPKQLYRRDDDPIYTNTHLMVEISLNQGMRDGWLFKGFPDYIIFYRKHDAISLNTEAFREFCVDNINWKAPPLKYYKDYRIRLRESNKFHGTEELSLIPISDILSSITEGNKGYRIFKHSGLNITTNEDVKETDPFDFM